MITIRSAHTRGLTQLDWLKSYHSFSFGEYYDPNHMSFGHLRVINDDIVQPAKGFQTHPHRNMEIITYVISGQLAHQDSTGTGSVIKPGEIQRMTAGSGIAHSEFNASQTEPVHLLQIWITPMQRELTPGYEQKAIPTDRFNELILIGSPTGDSKSVKIHQNAYLYVAYMTVSHMLHYTLKDGRKGWLQLIKGQITINDQTLSPGDGAMISDEADLHIKCHADAEFLFFDL